MEFVESGDEERNILVCLMLDEVHGFGTGAGFKDPMSLFVDAVDYNRTRSSAAATTCAG